MDREANPPVPPLLSSKFRQKSTSEPTSSSSYSFTSSSSSSELFRDVQAAFKRHPLGSMQSNSLMPKRSVLVPKRETSSSLDANVDADKSKDVASLSQGHAEQDPILQIKSQGTAAVGEAQEDASITTSISGTTSNTFDEHLNTFYAQRDPSKCAIGCKETNPLTCSHLESQNDQGQRKVRFSVGDSVSCQGADDRMATGMENLSSHLGSIALTEMDWDARNQVEVSTIVNNDSKLQHVGNTESDIGVRLDGGMSSSLAKRTTVVQDQLPQFRNFLGQPATQFSVLGSSCPTSTYNHSTSAPMLSSTTYCSSSHQERSTLAAAEPVGDSNLNPEPAIQENMIHSKILIDLSVSTVQASASVIDPKPEVKELLKEQVDSMVKESSVSNRPAIHNDKSMDGSQLTGISREEKHQVPLSKTSTSDMKLEASKSVKQAASGKGVSVPRKRNYDPDLFFKVNGKLYQRLGKIGSGGSSEVHKVISSDCTIYALKKIKLKGRDYATAFGFCQEIEYLNKLKGKNNIIQLIDYEVTDKALLREVLNGSMSNKDGRVRDDGYIYMVLEYGEIDLAHMLSHKWKEMDGSNQTIDDNWLRFYWQQILKAVNTIHEERIVHSDLKPANFLLVKGSLKLIDFGIAKAIMSDTTNIQRDSQVGTLSYMSPEAFMCNENDANGNTIKCGRPSDIWSLGCILYQMVYGRTPFSDYKTFWAKFKVITDPNHEITYEPVSNPWLLDLMKKCLAWDRNERWRIPQLLQHPFLVPPVPTLPSSSEDQICKQCGNLCR